MDYYNNSIEGPGPGHTTIVTIALFSNLKNTFWILLSTSDPPTDHSKAY